MACAADVAGRAAPSPQSDFSYPTRYFDCIAQTDPYGARDDVFYAGPLVGLSGLDAPVWPLDPQHCPLNVFAYLPTSDLHRELLCALAERGANTLCVTNVSGVPGSAAPPARTRVVSMPVQLDAAIRQADLIVGYGSFGLMTAARMAGKPQLVMPTEVDKTTLAKRMARDRSAVLLAGAGNIDHAISAALQLELAPVTADRAVEARLRAQLSGGAEATATLA